jgi:hypothetical protein
VAGTGEVGRWYRLQFISCDFFFYILITDFEDAVLRAVTAVFFIAISTTRAVSTT